jgi:hypothetical protein
MSHETNEAVVRKPAFPSAASVIFTGVAAIVAAGAAFGALHLGFAPWAMFVGWVAYFTRPISAAQGIKTGLCVWLGVAIGAAAALALGALGPIFGQAAILPVVFVVACVVLALRSVPPFDNVLAWFLGLIAFFASHLPPSLLSIAELGAAASGGILAGWIAQRLQARLAGPH